MPHTPTLSGESRVRSSAGELHAATLSQESLRHQSDERLVALTRAGSERAFSEITRRYQRQLRAYCSRIVGVERAQDAVQQALLQAFLSLRDGAPRQIALRPWLYRIAHNCSIDLLRMGSWEYDELDLEFDGVPQPPALFEQKQELRDMIDGMRRLPEAQRQALALRELEGCSYEEISARLGHTGSGVRQLIFRARSALRKGAAALVPFGALRERLFGMTPAVDAHHVAGFASVPASSGGGLDTVGAAALAVVAVLGGVAGGVRGGHQGQSAGQRTAGTPAPVAASVVPGAAPGAAPVTRAGQEGSAPRRGPRSGADAPAPVAAFELQQPVAPLQATPPPPAPPAAPAAPPVATAPPQAPPVVPEVVQQQALSSPPAEPGAPVEPAADLPPAPGGPQPGAPTAPPAGDPGGGGAPVAGSPATPKPSTSKPGKAKPKPVTAKPGPAAGAPKPPKPSAPRPPKPSAPSAAGGRPPKAPVAPARPKKPGTGTAPAKARA